MGNIIYLNFVDFLIFVLLNKMILDFFVKMYMFPDCLYSLHIGEMCIRVMRNPQKYLLLS